MRAGSAAAGLKMRMPGAFFKPPGAPEQEQ